MKHASFPTLKMRKTSVLLVLSLIARFFFFSLAELLLLILNGGNKHFGSGK